jgi:hypothetical protein
LKYRYNFRKGAKKGNKNESSKVTDVLSLLYGLKTLTLTTKKENRIQASQNPASYPMDTGGSFPRGKVAGV